MSRRTNRFDMEVFSYRELEHYPVGSHEALLLIVDYVRWPSHVPEEFAHHLRLRIPPSELAEAMLEDYESLLRHARYALNFVRLHGASCQRFAVASPDGEVRGPALAVGLMGALDFPFTRVDEIARTYPRLSRTLRDRVLEAAGKLPPTRLEQAAHSPLTKAALLLLAKLTEGRFHS
ncbi:MAG: hypothetical protein ACRELC_13505 [Gemmatimonadota bacterium]